MLTIVLAIPALGYAAGRLGAALGVAACATLLAATIGVADGSRARARGLARGRAGAPGRGRGGRGAAVQRDADALVRPRPPPGRGRDVRDLAVVVADPDREPLARDALATAPSAGFTPVGTEKRDRLLIARFRAAGARPVTRLEADSWVRAHLGANRGGAGGVLLTR